MRVRGRDYPSFEDSWASVSTCSSSCTAYEEPITLQPTYPPHTPWSVALNHPPTWKPPSPHPSSLPSTSQRTELVRGARGRRPSVVANLLHAGASPSPRGEVDARAFHRYYEGSTLEGDPPSSSSGREGRICGGSGVLGGTLASFGVVLPTKLESLLKLLAQSLHLVLQALCTRKGRRKDRECSSTNEHKLYLDEAVLERNIPETDLRQLVDLPPGLGYEEWLASHTIDFFHHINLLYGTVCEFCTLTGCPDMTGPGLRQYLWFDEKGKKTRVAAPQYVDYVMTFTQNTVNDEAIFPTKFDNDFPSSFESIVKKIHRLLFHVVAHLYHAHFREVMLLSLHAHLNCIFAHFVLFNEKFHLVDEKETEILHDLVLALKIHPEAEGVSMQGPAHDEATSTDVTNERLSSPIGIPSSEGCAGGGSPSGTTGEDTSCFPPGHNSSPGGFSGLGDALPLPSLGAVGDREAPLVAATSITSVFDNRVSLTDALP